MCPICGKYRELTRCVRRMRIAHPTPPRGGGIPHACPTPEAAENFRPDPSARPPIGRSRSRPSRRRSRLRVCPSRRRERPDSAFPRRSPAVEGSQAFARRQRLPSAARATSRSRSISTRNSIPRPDRSEISFIYIIRAQMSWCGNICRTNFDSAMSSFIAFDGGKQTIYCTL